MKGFSTPGSGVEDVGSSRGGGGRRMPGKALMMSMTGLQRTSRQLRDHREFEPQRRRHERGMTGEKVEGFSQTRHVPEVIAKPAESTRFTSGSARAQTYVLYPAEMIDGLAAPFVTVVPLEIVEENSRSPMTSSILVKERTSPRP